VLLPNLCANTIEASDGQLSEEQEDRLVWAASTVLGGGLDTASAIHRSPRLLIHVFAERVIGLDVLSCHDVESFNASQGAGRN
jgi:hypothetical protein